MHLNSQLRTWTYTHVKSQLKSEFTPNENQHVLPFACLRSCSKKDLLKQWHFVMERL